MTDIEEHPLHEIDETSDKASHAGITVREMRPRDATALRILRHRAIRECAHLLGTPPAVELARGSGYYRRQLIKDRAGCRSAHLGVWRGSDLIGMAGIKAGRDHGKTYGLIFSMYLEPEMRGYGHGEALLRVAIQRVRDKWNPDRLRMNVEVNNQAALRLYQRHEFNILRTNADAFRIGDASFDVYVLERPATDTDVPGQDA